jgi:phage gp36-like protein
MATYVSGSDLRERYDVRAISQLVSDTSSPIPVSSIDANTNVATALNDAEGEVLAALLAGGRYSTDDLDLLTGTALAYLQRIICDIAMLYLIQRRPKLDTALFERLTQIYETHLKRLQDGKAIFGGNSATEAAARPSVDGVSYNDLVKINSIAVRKPRFFPRPELPIGRNR